VILRGVDWVAVLVGCTLGALILVGCAVLTSDVPPLGYLRLGLVALAAAAAFVLDEPAAAAVDAAPRTRRRRTAVRAVVVVLPFSIWVGGIGAVAAKVPVAPVGGLLVEGGGVLTVTVALSSILRMAGRSEPGEIVSALMCTSVLAALAFNPTLHLLRPFPLDGDWTSSTVLWAALTVAGAMLVVAASRDPYLPGERLRR